MKIKIYDNGGETFDQYTVIINGEVYGMSTNAMSPDGFNQYCHPESLLSDRSLLGKEVQFEDLPNEVQRAIIDRKK